MRSWFTPIAGADRNGGNAALAGSERVCVLVLNSGFKLPKIKKDDIDELSVAAPEKKPVILKKADKAWKLSEPLATDADHTAVEAALGKLEELEVIGVAATKPENHEKLEVTDAKAVHVIAKQAGKPVLDLLIGSYSSGNTMVREKSAVNVATVKGSIKYPFDKEVKEWRDRSIVDVPVDQVQSAVFANKNGTWKFVKADGAWKQAPGEKEIAEFDPSKVKAQDIAIAAAVGGGDD